jgi:hypothetical protein
MLFKRVHILFNFPVRRLLFWLPFPASPYRSVLDEREKPEAARKR